MKAASLFHAYEWICDDCGVNNFCSSVSHTPSESERETIKEQLDIDDEGFDNLRMFMVPSKVTCESCGAEFSTKDDDED